MASIFKRGQKYTARVRLKAKKITKTFPTKAEAREWAIQTEADINNRQIDIMLKNITVGDLIQRYIAEVTPQKRGSTNEQISLNRVLKTSLADVLVSDLLPVRIAEWRDNRLKQVQLPSVVRELSTISSIFNHAMKGRLKLVTSKHSCLYKIFDPQILLQKIQDYLAKVERGGVFRAVICVIGV